VVGTWTGEWTNAGGGCGYCRRWPALGAGVAANVSTPGSARAVSPRSKCTGAGAVGTVVFLRDLPSVVCALSRRARRALPCRSGTIMPTVSAETLGLQPEISFRSRGDTAHGHRTGLPGGNRAQARGCKRLLLRLRGGHIEVACRNINIEALAAQLVIQRCLSHARHRRDAQATKASTTCGQPPQILQRKWTSCGRYVGRNEHAGPLGPACNAA